MKYITTVIRATLLKLKVKFLFPFGSGFGYGFNSSYTSTIPRFNQNDSPCKYKKIFISGYEAVDFRTTVPHLITVLRFSDQYVYGIIRVYSLVNSHPGYLVKKFEFYYNWYYGVLDLFDLINKTILESGKKPQNVHITLYVWSLKDNMQQFVYNQADALLHDRKVEH